MFYELKKMKLEKMEGYIQESPLESGSIFYLKYVINKTKKSH